MKGFGEPGRANKAATASADTATASTLSNTCILVTVLNLFNDIYLFLPNRTIGRNDKTLAANGGAYVRRQ